MARSVRPSRGRRGARLLGALGLGLGLCCGGLSATELDSGDAARAPARVATAPGDTARAESVCRRVGAAEVLLAQPVSGDTLMLPHRLIDADRFEVVQDTVIFRAGRDYLLDPVGGRLVWIGEGPESTSPIRARYRYLPLDLPTRWQGPGREIVAGEGEPEPGAAAGPEAVDRRRGLPAGARLEVGGSKTLSLEFGNRQDVTLNQSLDLTIRGQLAQDVQVSAVLTDRNLPLQPEGTTAELADLDKVLISVTSPWGQMHLGDLTVRHDEVGFLAHRRELEGLSARAEQRRVRGGGVVGRGTGQHAATEFFGEDGKQGPYRIVTSRPGQEALLIAGSERVWLDGRRLERGEEADYTVDYSRGEILFTTRNPITARSEIRVEYQVRRGVFERSYYALDSATGDSARSVSVAWVRERDDPGSSPTLELSDEERALLRAAGDSSTAALEGGVRFVGAGQGPYELVESDTLEAAIFVYLGVDSLGDYRGSYEVDFVQVSEREGDYRDSTLAGGEVIYVYAGRRQADFLPGRSLQLPESRDVVGLRAGGALGAGLTITGEGAVSWYDRNVLSPQDDDDNAGAAARVEGSWRPAVLWGGRADAVRLFARYRGVEERFEAPEAIDPAFYHRRWNAPAGLVNGRDRRGAAGLQIRPGGGADLLAEFERLEAPRGYTGRRWHVRALRSGPLHGRAEVWLGRSRLRGEPGRETRGEGRVGWLGRFALEGIVEFEDLKRGTGAQTRGEAFESYSIRAGSGRLLSWMQTTITTRLRRDFERGAAGRSETGRRRLFQVENEAAGGGGLVHLLYARNSARDGEGRLLSRSDLADWVVSHRAAERLFRGEWRGKLTVEESPLLTERLVYVGTEGGHYDSLGQYVGVGDYELYYAEGDSSRLETRLDTALRLGGRPLARLEPEALAGLDASFYARMQLRTPRSVSALLEDPGPIVTGDAPARSHQGTVRGELQWRGSARMPTPRWRTEERRSTQRSASGFTRRQRTLAHTLEASWNARERLRMQLDLLRDRERRSVLQEGAGGEVSFEQRVRWRAGLEGTWRFWDPFSARVGSEITRETFAPDDRRRIETKALVGAVADFRLRGRVELNVERRWSDDLDFGARGFTVERPGWRLTLNGSIRPREGVTTSLWLRVDSREGRRTVVTGRMEARAYF